MVKKFRGAIERDHWYASDMPFAGPTIVQKSATVGVPWSYQLDPTMLTGEGVITATQVDGSALPEWLTYATTTRTIGGTPAGGSAGTLHIRLKKTLGEVEAISDFDLVIGT